jgi:hypothetical protein
VANWVFCVASSFISENARKFIETPSITNMEITIRNDNHHGAVRRVVAADLARRLRVVVERFAVGQSPRESSQ